MGYRLSSFFAVNPNDSHEIFVYFFGNGHERSKASWITKEVFNKFNYLSSRIGPEGVILVPSKRHFEEIEVFDHFSNLSLYDAKGNLEDELSSFDFLHSNNPFLIITEKPLSKKNDTKGILLCLNFIKNHKTLDQVFNYIIRAVKVGDIEKLIENFPDNVFRFKDVKEEKAVSRFINTYDFLEIKPNIFGIGIDLNKVLYKVASYLRDKKSSNL